MYDPLTVSVQPRVPTPSRTLEVSVHTREYMWDTFKNHKGASIFCFFGVTFYPDFSQIYHYAHMKERQKVHSFV